MYTDPGSGLLFVQLIGAAVLSLAYRFRSSLAGLFRWRPKNRLEQ